MIMSFAHPAPLFCWCVLTQCTWSVALTVEGICWRKNGIETLWGHICATVEVRHLVLCTAALLPELHYSSFVSCPPLLDKLINPGVSDYGCCDYWCQAHLRVKRQQCCIAKFQSSSTVDMFFSFPMSLCCKCNHQRKLNASDSHPLNASCENILNTDKYSSNMHNFHQVTLLLSLGPSFNLKYWGYEFKMCISRRAKSLKQ